ncbi:TPA: hypothetical protein ACLGW6_000042 [Salmonella enterica]
MSLEANLELNNQLLTQQNELQARNIALLERLVSTLASGVAMRPDTVAKVQEYHEACPAHEPKPEPEPQPETKAALTLDDLEFSDVIALACFYPEQVELSETMLQRAIDYRDAEGGKRVIQIDALDSALMGVKRAAELHKDVLLQLARAILANQEDLPTLASRRAFAETWLDTKPGERDTVKPKKASKQPRKGPFFVRHEDGKIGELSTEDELKAHIEAGYTEINKVEYLQRKEEAEKAEQNTGETDFAALRKQAGDRILRLAKSGYLTEAQAILAKFGAVKVREVPDDKLADVLALTEKALEG